MIKKVKTLAYQKLLLILVVSSFAFFSCNKDAEQIDGAALIKKYELAGNWKIMVSPKLMGIVPMTTGTVDGTITDEGNGIIRLAFDRFQEAPMPFQMTVRLRMKAKAGPQGELILENVADGHQTFDADPPIGSDGVSPDDAPPGIEIPDGALEKGLHSNGISSVSGVCRYEQATTVKGVTYKAGMRLILNLDPNVGLPVVVAITTLEKIK